MSMQSILTTLRELAELLERHGWPYAVMCGDVRCCD